MTPGRRVQPVCPLRVRGTADSASRAVRHGVVLVHSGLGEAGSYTGIACGGGRETEAESAAEQSLVALIPMRWPHRVHVGA